MMTEHEYYMNAINTKLTCLFSSELCLELFKDDYTNRVKLAFNLITGFKFENKPMTTKLEYYMTAVKTKLTCLFSCEISLELFENDYTNRVKPAV